MGCPISIYFAPLQYVWVYTTTHLKHFFFKVDEEVKETPSPDKKQQSTTQDVKAKETAPKSSKTRRPERELYVPKSRRQQSNVEEKLSPSAEVG